jgi:hypothetical protein
MVVNAHSKALYNSLLQLQCTATCFLIMPHKDLAHVGRSDLMVARIMADNGELQSVQSQNT